jgi:hypothetical protein
MGTGKTNSSEMLSYKELQGVIRTLRDARLTNRRLNQSWEVMNRLYNSICKPVDENRVFLAMQAVQEASENKNGLVTLKSLLEKLSQEEINYAVAWQMIKVIHISSGMNEIEWVCRQDRDGWCQPKRVPGLLEFIKANFEKGAKIMWLIALQDVFNRVEESGKFPAYTKEDIVKELTCLRLLSKIRLLTTKSMLAKNIGIELFDIDGIHYGFLKIEE